MSDKRPILWKEIKKPADWLAVMIGTFFGSGLLPKMPGTWGSLLSIPLVLWANENLSDPLRVLFWIIVILAGSWAASQFQRLFGVADNQNIVIDEVIGMGIAGWISNGSFQSICTFFILFRLFDIVKIPPVRAIDRWSKNATSIQIQGFGVMADDIAAGVQALIVYLIIQKFGWISGL